MLEGVPEATEAREEFWGMFVEEETGSGCKSSGCEWTSCDSGCGSWRECRNGDTLKDLKNFLGLEPSLEPAMGSDEKMNDGGGIN